MKRYATGSASLCAITQSRPMRLSAMRALTEELAGGVRDGASAR